MKDADLIIPFLVLAATDLVLLAIDAVLWAKEFSR
jgi:hypothetical protein